MTFRQVLWTRGLDAGGERLFQQVRVDAAGRADGDDLRARCAPS